MRGLRRRLMRRDSISALMIEFDSVAQAIAAHDSSGYQEALRVLGDAAERDIRIVEGAA